MTMSANEIRLRIESDITTGARQPGDRLPTVRAFAGELGVSPNTVAAAYKQLRDRALVIGRGRQGTVVAPQTRPTLSQISSVSAELVDALRGSPDPALLPSLGPSLAIAAAGPDVRYGDKLVEDSFAEAARAMFIADKINAENLTVTSGAMDAIEKILGANDLRAGDRVGVEDPGHIPVHQLVRSAGLQPVPLAIDQAGIIPESLSNALSQKLAALIVTPRAHNPTGAALTKSRAAELSKLLSSQPNTLLVQDDHAGPISGSDWVSLTPPGERHAIIRSLGKSLGPDLRISVATGDAITIDRVSIAVSNGPGWVSHLLQRAAAHLLTDKTAQELVANASRSYASRRNRLINALAERGIESSGPSGINVCIPTTDEQALVEACRLAGFAVRAAGPYRIQSAPAVRITISNLSNEQIDTIAAAISAASNTFNHAPAI